MSKSYVIYKDIAPGASEDAQVTSEQAEEHSDFLLVEERNDDPAYITLELNRWMLNGGFVSRDDNTVAFWSSALSDEDGAFADPPVIEISFGEQYSSVGITLSFDPVTGEYCSGVKIQWYQDSTLLSEMEYSPDAATYFCENDVVGYNKIVLTITKTSLPFRRARIGQILLGIIRQYGMTELRSVSINNEMDVSSLELPVSTMNWFLDTRDPLVFMFQLKQPVECWNGDALIGVYYINSHKRKGTGRYTIDCHDALGVLDESPFSGGAYLDGVSAKELLAEIVDSDFDLVFEVEDETLYGVLAASTKREAIQQVIFAAGWCVSTDGRLSIRVFIPSTNPVELGRDRTFPGVEVETESIVTQVIVQAHTYAIDNNGNVEIGGVKYSDTVTAFTVNNPNVTANDKKNVKEVKGATLVSPAIGQAVAQRVYEHFKRRSSLSADFVWQGERLGECVIQPTPWGTEETGHLVKMDIKLSNTVVASGETLGGAT